MTLTNGGLSLLAKVIAGRRELRFTAIKFGDSTQNPTAAQILSLTDLYHTVNFSVPIIEIRAAGNGTVVIVGRVNNESLRTGFFVREIGLFAYDADLEEDILYAYSNQGAQSTYLAAGGADTLVDMSLNLVTVIDQAQNVTAQISADGVYISRSELTSHINSATPHPNVPNLAKELTSSDFYWAVGADKQLHTISKANLSKEILGDNLYELPHLDSRLAQTEINIANLYMQLNAEKEMGLEANLLLYEDFIDCDTVDLFSVKVNDEVAGTNSVCVESVDGIIEGCRYTISDGVRSQEVRVTSIAKNDSLYVVMFADDLRYTFNLAKTKLYRSTGLIYDNKLGGAGDLRSSTYRFSDVWQGAVADAAQTLTLATTQANAKNLSLSGDYAFTASGEFTLQ